MGTEGTREGKYPQLPSKSNSRSAKLGDSIRFQAQSAFSNAGGKFSRALKGKSFSFFILYISIN